MTALGVSWMVVGVGLVLETIITKDVQKWVPNIHVAIPIAALLFCGVGTAAVL